MEGIQTINALKAVQSSLPAQTTIPSDELVMLYAADGTPIAKIARDDLVKAVASVMASNSQTTFSKLLGVQANGTPMGIGPSDLASVLGAYNVLRNGFNISLNQDIILDNSDTTGSRLIAISKYDYGICFLGYVSWQPSETLILINVSNIFSVGLNSDGSILLYFDSNYKLHIKYNKTEGHEDLRLKYVVL